MTAKPDLFSALPEGSTLRACGEDGCRALAEQWTEANYQARAMIVSEQDTDDDVFFVLSGRARAATYTGSGREIVLSDLPPGEAFGIFAAIDGQPRSTNVVAVEESRIARLSAGQFNAVIDRHTGVMRALLRYLCDRIRYLSTRMTDVTTQTAEQRLIAELLRLAQRTDGSGKRAVIDPLPTQQELANLIFSQRESVGREMSKLTDQGLIQRRGRALTILNMAVLEAKLSSD